MKVSYRILPVSGNVTEDEIEISIGVAPLGAVISEIPRQQLPDGYQVFVNNAAADATSPNVRVQDGDIVTLMAIPRRTR